MFGPDALIFTAYHVVQDARAITVRDISFKELPDVRVEYIDPQHDIAILRSPGTVLPALTPSTALLEAQTEIVVRGSPRGTPKQVFKGQITSEGKIHSVSLSDARGKQIFARDIEIYTTDVTLYSGMSGAPVLNSAGRVIGILSGSYSEGRGIGWAIPINYALDLLGSAPKRLTARQIGAWPALDLMGPSWISYKRSFGKQFDAEHIAQLEILQTVVVNLRGRWTAITNTKKAVSGNDSARCFTSTKDSVEYTFDDVDEESAAIVGHYRDTTTVRSLMEIKNPAEFGDSTGIIIGACQKYIFGDEGTQKMSSSTKATVRLSVADVAAFPDEPRLNVIQNVTDCTGDLCSADDFGKQEMKDFEIITSKKIRWADMILVKDSD